MTRPPGPAPPAPGTRRLRGGRVTSVERETDGGAAWEVQVTGPDGPPVDVALDRAYRIVGADPDDDSEDPE